MVVVRTWEREGEGKGRIASEGGNKRPKGGGIESNFLVLLERNGQLILEARGEASKVNQKKGYLCTVMTILV